MGYTVTVLKVILYSQLLIMGDQHFKGVSWVNNFGCEVIECGFDSVFGDSVGK